MSESEPRFVTSPDGTRIAWYESGEGAPLLLVYGALMANTGWARLLPHLQPGHRLISFDRRGRGPSGDSPEYAAEREIEDVLAVAKAATDGPLDVFAHSSGAVLALMAMQRGLPVRRAVLYEPPLVGIRDPELEANMAKGINQLIEEGQLEAAMETILVKGMNVPEDQLARLRGEPRWQEQLGYAHTVAYDIRLTRSFDIDGLSRLSLPVLLLVGGASPHWMHTSAERIAQAIAGARVADLEGQGHNAIFGAPELVARETLPFLASND